MPPLSCSMEIVENEAFTPNAAGCCPECGALMLLAKTTPSLCALPELQTFRCSRCGTVMTWEIDAPTVPH